MGGGSVSGQQSPGPLTLYFSTDSIIFIILPFQEINCRTIGPRALREGNLKSNMENEEIKVVSGISYPGFQTVQEEM